MLSRQIAQKLRGYETPFYLYDTALLRQTLESVVYESKKYGYKVHYAIKANYDDHLLAIIREYGLGIDCASGNELRKAIEAGFDPKGIVYAGVGKRDKELRYAIEQDILSKYIDAPEEKGAESAVTDEPTIKLPPVDGSAIPSDFRLSLDELKFGRNYSGDK